MKMLWILLIAIMMMALIAILTTPILDFFEEPYFDENDGTSPNEVKASLARIMEGCGDICKVEGFRPMSGEHFDFIAKPDVRCKELLTNSAIDEPSKVKPPVKPPRDMVEHFTYGGKVRLRFGEYYDQRYLGNSAMVPVWTQEYVEGMMKLARNKKLPGNYKVKETNWLQEGLERAQLANASVLVIGSENPWVEACILVAGARHVTTLEYGSIQSEHPQITTITPDALRQRVAAGDAPVFDAVVSFSSLEHPGLGRYGDSLNPFGDRQAVARAWCLTRPAGKLVVGVPRGPRDYIQFNAHRVYGRAMLPHLLANWRLQWHAPEGDQRVMVLQRADLPPPAPPPAAPA